MRPSLWKARMTSLPSYADPDLGVKYQQRVLEAVKLERGPERGRGAEHTWDMKVENKLGVGGELKRG